MNPIERRIFFEVHRDLPREAPGSAASTRQALACVGDPGEVHDVLDAGCGPGMQTLELAQALPAARIVAVDLHRPYLRELDRRAVAAGVRARVHPVCADMARLPLDASRCDLVWSEGAAYLVGVERALTTWRLLLRAGGQIVFTDAVWLGSDAPARVRAFWTGYPGMQDIAGVEAAIRRAGLEPRAHFVLPESDWWDDYYSPMAGRIEALRARYAGDREAGNALDACQAEIDLYRDCSAWYGYAFFVAGLPVSS